MILETSKIKLSKNDIKRQIRLPNSLTKELSEMLGILIGDGHIGIYHGKLRNGKNYVRYDIRIAGNRDEREYLRHIMDLFYILFNLKLVYEEDPRSKSVILRAHSKGVIEFLNKSCGIPLNRKTDIVTIPKIIKTSNNDLKYAFLRGLADTDFSVTFRNRINKGHIYPIIKCGFKSRYLIEDLEKLFLDLGFKHCVYYNQQKYDKRFDPTTIHNLYLNGKENLERWSSKIGFSNPKFQKKVEKWKREGFCPPGYK